jgi:hypothetical protein
LVHLLQPSSDTHDRYTAFTGSERDALLRD